MNNADNSDATPDILSLAITEETAERILEVMYGVQDRHPAPQVAPDHIPALIQGLHLIYASAYDAHSLGSRELGTELDKLLRGIKGSKSPEELENWTTSEKFDHFAPLFQVAALEIWFQTNREVDYRDFRVMIADSPLQSFRVIKAVAEHIRTLKSTFDEIGPQLQRMGLVDGPEKLKQDIQREYYKYFCKRSELPDKTIVRTIGAVYAIVFGEEFTVSEIIKEFRRSDINRFNDGFPIRFACAVIRELKLHLLMAPIVPREKKRPNGEENISPKKNTELHALSPSDAPKHRSYDSLGNSLTVDVDAPFPWSLTKAEKDSFRDVPNNTWALPSDDWELVKNRIGDSWTNK